MQRVFLNKKEIDLKGVKITRKLQISSISNISERKSNHSYSIKIPFTKNNIEILDFLGVTGNDSLKPYEFIVADYLQNEIPIISNGYAVINQIKKNQYELTLYDGVISLGTILKGKKIKDLPLSNLNHYLNSINYIDSFNNDNGYIYAIGEYGVKSQKIEHQAPSVFCKTLVKSIFDSNDIIVKGSFFDSNKDFKGEVLTPSIGCTVENKSFYNIVKGGFLVNDKVVYVSYQTPSTYKSIFTLNNNNLVMGNVSNNSIQSIEKGVFEFSFSFKSSTNSDYSKIVLLVNGVGVFHSSIDKNNNINLVKCIVSINIGDIITIEVHSGSVELNDSGLIENIINFKISNFKINVALQKGGQLIEPIKYMGDLGQLEFIKDIMLRYALIMKPINSNTFHFKQIEDILRDKEGAEDWTNKIKTEFSEKYKPNYAKKNIAKYKYSKNIKTPKNDGVLNIDNTNLSDNKVFLSSIFEIPEVHTTIEDIKVYNIPIWKKNNNIVENTNTAIKVMKIKYFDLTRPIKKILFNEVNGVEIKDKVPFLSLEKMSMQYYINSSYPSFSNLLEKYKEVYCKANLSVMDIYNLDFFKLKYLEQTGRYYYLENIINSVNTLSKIKLIEISEFIKNKPPKIKDYNFQIKRKFTKIINKNEILLNYFDFEFDKPLKIKIINGFSNDLPLYQNGIEITSETEIDILDLDLKCIDKKAGYEAYINKWTYQISDIGSGFYSEEKKLIGNVLDYVNYPPIASAGSDRVINVVVDETSGSYFQSIFLNGSGSTDANQMRYFWTVIESPLNINLVSSGTNASFRIKNTLDYLGTYKFKLLVVDEFGLSGYDFVEIKVLGTFNGGGGGNGGGNGNGGGGVII